MHHKARNYFINFFLWKSWNLKWTRFKSEDKLVSSSCTIYLQIIFKNLWKTGYCCWTGVTGIQHYWWQLMNCFNLVNIWNTFVIGGILLEVVLLFLEDWCVEAHESIWTYIFIYDIYTHIFTYTYIYKTSKIYALLVVRFSHGQCFDPEITKGPNRVQYKTHSYEAINKYSEPKEIRDLTGKQFIY